ncbi:MAG: diguanylate cyclase [Spirochaetales bacterium]|nr:diguanylate cyclase [Spirochaetales bacterium]
MNLFSSLDLALALLCFYVGTFHLYLYLKRSAGGATVHFPLLCYAIALYAAASAFIYASDTAASGLNWQRIQYFCSIVLAVEFLNLTYRFLDRRSDAPKKAFLVALGALFIAGLVFPGLTVDATRQAPRELAAFGASVSFHEAAPGLLWNALMAVELPGMVYVYILLARGRLLRKQRDLTPLLVAFPAFFVAAILDNLVYSGSLRFIYTAEYGFMAVLMAMDLLLLQRFIGVFREVENLNLHLGEKVEERTREIKRLADELRESNAALLERNADLQEHAERDGMTLLLNHAAFHRRLGELYSLARRQRFAVAAMLLDVDKFKEINDSLGHQAGDEVIKRIAAALKESVRDYDLKSRYRGEGEAPALRSYDIAGRYGGDEFAIVLPFCGAKDAVTVAERVCSRMRSLSFADRPELRVTVSVGCSVVADPSLLQAETELIRLADKALYVAKDRGRDRAVVLSFDAAAPDGVELGGAEG